MKVLICGEQTNFDPKEVGEALEHHGLKPEVIITTAETDLEKYVINWCNDNGVKHKTQAIDWSNTDVEGAVIRTSKYGQEYNARAAFQRNEQLVLESDAVLHLHNHNRTTNSIVEEAEKTETQVFTWPVCEEEDIPF
jgi:hypothetical protein